MLKLLKNFWPQILIAIVVFAFFSKLFFPPSIFVNPDYGRSDLIDFNLPTRQALGESLKKFEIPLWEPRIGQGFPLFDEGQVGTFYIPNLILFFLFPTWLAFNLGFITTFLIAATGTYLLARSFNLSKASSYVAAITYAFSAIFVLHIHHYNLIQTASIVPWLFWTTNQFVSTKRLIYLSLVPIILSQQIFAGFPQITFYSLFGLTIFLIFKIFFFKSKINKIKVIFFFFAAILLGFIIGSIQLAATYNLTSQTERFNSQTPKKILTDFPMKFENLKTAIGPFILGSPKNATYPLWKPGQWGIFWESNLYFGIVQLTLIFMLIISLIRTKKNRDIQVIYFWLFFAVLGITLSLGSLAPLHPIFSIPPFSYFRVPSRFLMFTFLGVSILTGYAIQQLLRIKFKNIRIVLIFIILLLSTLDIFKTWSSYNLAADKNSWLSPPELASSIPQGSRILAIGQFAIWQEIFASRGWQDTQDYYLFFRNLISQNSNITYGLDNVLVYAGMIPKRTEFFPLIINENLKADQQEIIIEKPGLNALEFSSVEYVTSYKKINSEKLEFVKSVKYDTYEIFLYRNKSALPKSYAVNDFVVAKTFQEVQKILKSENFNPRNSAIVEKEINLDKNSTAAGEVRIENRTNNKINIKASLQSEAIVVLTETFYPGWQVKVDDMAAEIFPVNVNSKGVKVPAGNHKIEFLYKPQFLYLFGPVSLAGFLISIFIIYKARKLALS